MRNPAGTGFCWAMISLTLVTALAVSEIGAFLVTSGTFVVAIRISLALKLFNYNKIELIRRYLSCSACKYWMPLQVPRTHCSILVTSRRGRVLFTAGPCQTGL